MDVTVEVETAHIVTSGNGELSILLLEPIVLDTPVMTSTVTIFPLVMVGGASPRAPGILGPSYTAALASGHG